MESAARSFSVMQGCSTFETLAVDAATSVLNDFPSVPMTVLEKSSIRRGSFLIFHLMATTPTMASLFQTA